MYTGQQVTLTEKRKYVTLAATSSADDDANIPIGFGHTINYVVYYICVLIATQS